MNNRDTVAQELTTTIIDRLKGTPISVKRLGLANVQPPDVITEAREAAKKREIEIQQVEAALEIAKKQQEVDLKEAETQVLVNKKLAQGVNGAFVTQRWLKVMENLSKNPEGKGIIMPSEAISNPSIMMGVNNRALKK